jgi:signal transduction histidine kinase
MRITLDSAKQATRRRLPSLSPAALSCEGETADRGSVHAGRPGNRYGAHASDPIVLRAGHGAETILKATLDTLPMPVVMLDGRGTVVVGNSTWHALIRKSRGNVETGGHYLALDFLAALPWAELRIMRKGLRAVARGVAPEFEHVVRVASADGECWYRIRAVRALIDGVSRILVTHEDTTSIHATQRMVDELWQRLLTVQDEERRRIAAELHDSTAQQLTAAALYLQSLGQKLKRNRQACDMIDQVQHTISEAQKEIHTLSYLLHPPHLYRDGLARTLTSFVDGFAHRSELAAAIDIVGDVDGLAPDVQLALLRVVQEALSNVHRHAAAHCVRVRLKRGPAMLRFCIGDDGRGRRPPASPVRVAPGLGIAGMQERIRKLGGAIRIRSGPRGTVICGSIPLAHRGLRGGERPTVAPLTVTCGPR